MGKLVDIDKLIHGNTKDYMSGKKTLIQVLAEEPAAFDRYTVIEQMKEKSKYARVVGEEKPCELLKLADVIEVLEGGGINRKS